MCCTNPNGLPLPWVCARPTKNLWDCPAARCSPCFYRFLRNLFHRKLDSRCDGLFCHFHRPNCRHNYCRGSSGCYTAQKVTALVSLRRYWHLLGRFTMALKRFIFWLINWLALAGDLYFHGNNNGILPHKGDLSKSMRTKPYILKGNHISEWSLR